MAFRGCVFTSIEADAFDATPFKSLKTLTFENVTNFSLESGRFVGIDELSELTFINAPLASVDERFMSRTATHLLTFEMISTARGNVRVNDLLGGTQLPLLRIFHLECAVFQGVALSETNLAALVVVHTLKLIDCEIAAIVAAAFDRISKTLKILNLQRNRLRTLDKNIFDALLLHGVAEINLANNPWDCDANVAGLAEKLCEHQLPFDSNQCTARSQAPTPLPVTEKKSMVSPAVVSCANSIQKNQRFSVKYNPRVQTVVVKVLPRSENGTSHVYIVFLEHPVHTVKEVEMCTKSAPKKCVSVNVASGSKVELPLDAGYLNSVYTICALENLRFNTHPLHCISLPRTFECHSNTWIPMSAKIWVVPSLVASYSISVLLGLAIAFGMFKLKPQLLRGSRRVVVLGRKCRGSVVVVMPKEWSSER